MSKRFRRTPSSTPSARRHSRRNRRRSGTDRRPTGDGQRNVDSRFDAAATGSAAAEGDGRGTATVVSLLLGTATSMAVAGLVTRFAEVFVENTICDGMVIGMTLLALAVGVRLPQRFALWLCETAWRRFVSRGQTSPIADVLLARGTADRPLYWAVSAMVALLAGILTALLPFNLRIALFCYEGMRANFIWPATPLALLQALTSFAAVVVPFTAVGLAISCAHRLGDRHGQWDTRATAWLAIGAAGGCLLALALGGARHGADLTLIAASLPALIASMIAALASSARPVTVSTEGQTDPAPLPVWSDRWPRLLRVGIVAVGGAGVGALAIWPRHFEGWTAGRHLIVPAMFAAMGAGVLAGCRRKQSGRRSIGGFGVACAFAGVVTACGTWALVLGAPDGHGRSAVLACASVGAIGFATAYGRQTLLHRVASRSAAGARILTRILGGGALIIWIGVPAATRSLGLPATVMLVALSLLALGGTLIIHEPSYSRRTRRMRLGAVFASIGAIIVLAGRDPNPPRAGGSPAVPPYERTPSEPDDEDSSLGRPDDR